ncbi:putative transcription factor Ovo-like 1 [Megalops cyprinoides]|uniref:putative transcription factor Ovo-like 1 n=1 Tax=Megalops cyprinoides TaxID=118141 RepID=UPI001864AE6C|nr:putative transcription factor Ovo-like 1 [Megalops cyprinoides]
MPRAFLVKKSSVSPGKRNWSEVPDHERGDIYIPVSMALPLHTEEASPAELAPCHPTHGERSKHTHLPAHSPHLHAHTAELPSSTAQGEQLSPHTTNQQRAKESTYVRSKIKASATEKGSSDRGCNSDFGRVAERGMREARGRMAGITVVEAVWRGQTHVANTSQMLLLTEIHFAVLKYVWLWGPGTAN